MRRLFAALALLLTTPAVADWYSPPPSSAAAASTNTVVANIAADGFSALDGAIPSGSAILTSASRACVAGDVGKTIIVAGTGTLGTIAAPAAPTVAQWSNGALAATSYFVKTTYVDAAGNETSASAETGPFSGSLNKTLYVSAPPPISGAMGWNVYVSNTGGGGSGAETRQNGATATAPVTNGVTAAGNPTLHFAATAAQLQAYLTVGIPITVSDTTAPTAIPANTYIISVTGTTAVMNQNAAGAGVGNGDSIVFTPVNATGSAAYLPFHKPWYEPTTGLIVGAALPGGNTTSYAGPQVGVLPSPACTGSTYNLPFTNGSGFTYTGSAKTEWAIGTDQSAALKTLITANPDNLIILPKGQILLNATSIPLDHVQLQGQGVISQLTAQSTQTEGTQFLLVSPTVVPFTVKGAVRVTGIGFMQPGIAAPKGSPPAFWGAPAIYPPVFEDDGTSDVNTWQLDHDAFFVTNLFSQVGSGSIKGIKWDTLNPYCVDTCIVMQNIGETLFVSNTDFNPNNVEFDGASTTTKHWSALNSVWFVAQGNGTPNGSCATNNVGNIDASANFAYHGFAELIVTQNAHFVENLLGSIDGNAGQIIDTDPGSDVRGTMISGVNTIGSNFSTFDSQGYPAVNVHGGCNSAGAIYFTGGSISAQNGVFRFDNGGGTGVIQDLIISNMKLNYCQSSGAINPCVNTQLGYLNDAKIDLEFANNSVQAANTGANVDGLEPAVVSQGSITGNGFNGQFYAIDMGLWTAGQLTESNNTAQATGGTYWINGGTNGAGFAGLAVSTTDNADKPLNFVANYTTAQTNAQLLGMPFGSPSMHTLSIEGCGPGGGGGAGIVAANPSGGAGGGGGECHRKTFNLADLLNASYVNNNFYVNGGNAGLHSAGALGGNGTAFTFSKNSAGCAAHGSPYTASNDVTHCIDTFGAGGGGALGVSGVLSIGGGAGDQLADGAQASAAVTLGCANSGGGSGVVAAVGTSCGTGGSGGVITAAAGPRGASNTSGLGGAGGGAGGGFNTTAQAGGTVGNTPQCQSNPGGGSGGNGSNGTNGGGGTGTAVASGLLYLPGCGGAGGGAADGTHTAGLGQNGGTGSGGGGGGSALTGGTAAQGGDGAAAGIRITIQ